MISPTRSKCLNPAQIAADAGVRNAYTIPSAAWAADARRIDAEQTNNYTPLNRAAKIRAAQSATRRALWASRLCRNDLAQSLRDMGLVLAMQGRLNKSLRRFKKSLRIARRLGQRYQESQTLLAMARIGREANWPEAEEWFQEAQSKAAPN